MKRDVRLWLLTCLSVGWLGCGADGRRHEDTSPDGGAIDAGIPTMDGVAMDGSASDATVYVDGSLLPDGSPFTTNDAGQVLCGTAPCACSDGLDQDADGLIDLADPECVSSWDNDEASFATGMPGDNRDNACQDCFFDGNSGSGNDGCRVATSCLTDPTDTSSGQGSCATCAATDKCRTTCQAYTPNGCDCFGCCTVLLGSNITKSVLLAPGCSIDGNDTTGCTECVPSDSCSNKCGECELCPGKTLADLPASCANPADGGVGGDAGSADGGVPVPRCDNGEPTCGDSVGCAAGTLCQFGCCILAPFVI